MARIPTYTAQSRAVQTTGVPRVRGIPMQDFSSQGIMQAGSELTKIGAQLLKAADDDAAHQAKVNAQLKLNQLETELQTVDPIKALTSYDIRAQAIIDEAGSSLSDNARATYDIASREAVARVKIGVQKDGIRRGREKLESNLVSGIDANVMAVRGDDTVGDRRIRLDNVREMLAGAVTNRVIAADVAARYLVKYQNDAEKGRAAFHVRDDPADFIKVAGTGDEYKSLTGEQRAKYIAQAEKRLKSQRVAKKTSTTAADNAAEKQIKTVLQAVKRDQDVSDPDRRLLDPDVIDTMMTDTPKRALLKKLVVDEVAFAPIYGAMNEMSNAELIAANANFESEGSDATEDIDLADQNYRQYVRFNTRFKQIIAAREAEANAEDAVNIKKINTRFAAFNARQTLSPEDEEWLSPAFIRSTINNKKVAENLIANIEDQRKFLDQTANITELDDSGVNALAEKLALEGKNATDIRVAKRNRDQAESVVRFRDKIIKSRNDQRAAADKLFMSEAKLAVKAMVNRQALTDEDRKLLDEDHIRATMHNAGAADLLIRVIKDEKQFAEETENLEARTDAELAELLERVRNQGGDASDLELAERNKRQEEQLENEIAAIANKRAKSRLAADQAFAKKVTDVLGAVNRAQDITEDQRLLLDPEFIREFMFDREAAEVLAKTVEGDVGYAEKTANLRGMSREDLTALDAELQAEGRDGGDADTAERQAKRAANFRKRFQQIIKARLDDPATAAIRSNEEVLEKYQQFIEAPNDPGTYKGYAEARDAAYETLGISVVDQRLLPVGVAKGYVKQFANLQPEQAAERILELRDGLGEDWPSALNELQKEGLDDRTSMLMAIDDPQLRTNLARIIQQGTTEEFKKRIDTTLLKDFNKKLTKQMSGLFVAGQLPGASMGRSISSGVELLAFAKLQTAAAATADEAVTSAYKEIVTDNYHIITGDRLRGIIPKSANPEGVDAGVAEPALVRWFERNPDFQYDTSLFSSTRGQTPEEAMRIARRGLAQSGEWQIIKGGTEAQLHVRNSPVLNADNKPIIVNIDAEIAADLKFRRRTVREANKSATKARSTVRNIGAD